MVANARLRYPGEWFNLMLAAFFGLVIFLVLSALTLGLCCLWGFVGFLITFVMVGAANNHLKVLGNSIDKKHPKLYSICEEAADGLGVDLPAMYLDGSEQVNAYTRGVISPVIVLNKGLVEIMNDNELKFVVGHELGHIKLYHFAIRTMFDSSIVRVPMLAYIPLLIFKMLFLNGRMSRSFEHSADRAGLHACRNLEDAVSCMIKLKTGDKEVKPSLVKMAIAGKLDLDDNSFLVELFSTHPDFEDRIRKMVDYAKDNDLDHQA
jgi:Zn-dependent protease with chaperone function